MERDPSTSLGMTNKQAGISQNWQWLGHLLAFPRADVSSVQQGECKSPLRNRTILANAGLL